MEPSGNAWPKNVVGIGARPVLAAAAAVVIILLASTLVLWAHYGTAVFYEMIVAGLAACM